MGEGTQWLLWSAVPASVQCRISQTPASCCLPSPWRSPWCGPPHSPRSGSSSRGCAWESIETQQNLMLLKCAIMQRWHCSPKCLDESRDIFGYSFHVSSLSINTCKQLQYELFISDLALVHRGDILNRQQIWPCNCNVNKVCSDRRQRFGTCILGCLCGAPKNQKQKEDIFPSWFRQHFIGVMSL